MKTVIFALLVSLVVSQGELMQKETTLKQQSVRPKFTLILLQISLLAWAYLLKLLIPMCLF